MATRPMPCSSAAAITASITVRSIEVVRYTRFDMTSYSAAPAA